MIDNPDIPQSEKGIYYAIQLYGNNLLAINLKMEELNTKITVSLCISFTALILCVIGFLYGYK